MEFDMDFKVISLWFPLSNFPISSLTPNLKQYYYLQRLSLMSENAYCMKNDSFINSFIYD